MAQVRGFMCVACALERLRADKEQQHAPIGMARRKEGLIAGHCMPSYGTDLARSCMIVRIHSSSQRCYRSDTLCVQISSCT